MEVAIRKMGNSQGVLIPKPILAQVGLESKADLRVRDGVIEIRPVRQNPRDGWAHDAKRLAASPMTTGSRPAAFRVPVGFQGKRGLILVDQIRTLDRTRLVKRLGALRSATLSSTLQTLEAMFAPSL